MRLTGSGHAGRGPVGQRELAGPSTDGEDVSWASEVAPNQYGEKSGLEIVVAGLLRLRLPRDGREDQTQAPDPERGRRSASDPPRGDRSGGRPESDLQAPTARRAEIRRGATATS